MEKYIIVENIDKRTEALSHKSNWGENFIKI